MKAEFVHLHNHTEYSLLDGSCKLLNNGKPSELFTLITNYKMSALAITDHGNMYGAMEFYHASLLSGIKPIIGCEVYITTSRFNKKLGNKKGNYNHLTLLAKDFIGYQNLMRIVSIGFIEGFYYKPRIDKEILSRFNDGLIALSGCLAGEIATALSENNVKQAQDVAIEYRNIFGKDNFYIEIMDNNLKEQKKIIPKLIELSKKTNIPMVVTNDCHFLLQSDYEIHDVLLCIGTNKILTDNKRLRFGSDLFYYRSPEEMSATFSYIPEAIKNTLSIAEKVDIKIPEGKPLIPKFKIPGKYNSDTEYLRTICNIGFEKRYKYISYDKKLEYKKRLEDELVTIEKMGFSSYFLIVADFVNYAKYNNIPVGPGRGSGAGSIVAYSLGITDICPLKYGLIFERFLNQNRSSMPDLDIDFADFGRDAVIKYVIEKYGKDKCAQIITFGSMQARLVIKDVARVMGFTALEASNITKFIPYNTNIANAIKNSKSFLNFIKSDKRIEKLIKISKKLEGLKRHVGIHSAGMVIANENITNYSPLSKSSRNNVITTQYDGTCLSYLGLLKIDFLGLKTLTVINDCVSYIKVKFPNFNLEKISLNDKITYDLLSKANTTGVFQLESKGIKDLLFKLKPSCINDIIAINALYRPGPIGSGMLENFVNRKHGNIKITYDHPLQETILSDTYGVILYQEQVMQMVVLLADFTSIEADIFRKAISKKLPDVIENFREKFIKGSFVKNKISKNISEKIFNNIMSFAGYGFNKSHAAAYSIISYRTAYLKANYPLEYFTALLNSEILRSGSKDKDNKTKLVIYLNDAKNFGIKILSPNIQFSDGKFKICGKNSIRFGLLAIKNIGETFTDYIEKLSANSNNKRFNNIEDFFQKIVLYSSNKKNIESLIKSGACDCLGSNKFYLRANLLQNIKFFIKKALDKKKGFMQGILFDHIDNKKYLDSTIIPLELLELLNFEKEVLGLYISGYPLDNVKEYLELCSDYNIKYINDNISKLSQSVICTYGLLTIIKNNISKTKRKLYAKFRIEDFWTNIECIIFPNNFEKLKKYLVLNTIIVVKGKLLNTKKNVEMVVEEIRSIEEINKKFLDAKEIHIKILVKDYKKIVSFELKKIFMKYKGKTRVYINLVDNIHGNFYIKTDYFINCSNDFFNNIMNIIDKKNIIRIQ
ncbi:MAG: DNA polymerase III subunit alpha [Endomicrobium sp.]|nr:DNA polymerase III subunit alpha [Endomicrobium sp.]